MACVGFREWQLEYLKEKGITPEQARDRVVEKLRKYNANEDELKDYLLPFEQIPFHAADTIMEMTYGYDDQPERFCTANKCDLSDKYTFRHFENCLGN